MKGINKVCLYNLAITLLEDKIAPMQFLQVANGEVFTNMEGGAIASDHYQFASPGIGSLSVSVDESSSVTFTDSPPAGFSVLPSGFDESFQFSEKTIPNFPGNFDLTGDFPFNGTFAGDFDFPIDSFNTLTDITLPSIDITAFPYSSNAFLNQFNSFLSDFYEPFNTYGTDGNSWQPFYHYFQSPGLSLWYI